MTSLEKRSPMPAGLVISAAASGAGKTTVTLGLARAMRDRNLTVQPFKCGPDYIDPALHTAAAGRISINLDSWAMAPGAISALTSRSAGADIALAEGAMGLFDGVAKAGQTGCGASADIAALMGWPVVLVIDASGQAQTAAAVAQGLANFREGVQVTGVVLNKVASPRHETLLRAGFDSAGIAVFGALPRQASISMPERHLGLVQAEEQAGLEEILSQAGRFAAAHVDIDALVSAAACGQPPPAVSRRLRPPGSRIALARDQAFSFVYPHILEGWRGAGAEVLPFSPLADEAPDPSSDVCWLPGGYPELHAGRLSSAEVFRKGLRAFAEKRPVHGECGGYMALGERLVDADGTSHQMVGLLGLVTSFEKRRLHLGYRHCELLAPVPGLAAGKSLRGHEFHYASILAQPDAPLARVRDASANEVAETGAYRDRVSGTFFHFIAEAE